MFSRMSVNVLLKSVVGLLATGVVVLLAIGAWDSWNRLGVATRIMHVADASTPLFNALSSLRSDRSTSVRELQSDKQNGIDATLRDVRVAQMAALNDGLSALRQDDLGQNQTGVPALAQAIKKQAALHKESELALQQPKAARRAGLVQEVNESGSALIALVEKLSAELANMVKSEDALVSQLITIKQQAFAARGMAGDANLLLYNGILGQKLPADALAKYSAYIVKADTAWAPIEEIATGLPLPGLFREAMKKAQENFFAPDVVAERLNSLKSIVAGEQTGIDPVAWNKTSLVRLGSLLNVAVVSLRIIKEHAEEVRAGAQWKLIVQCGFLMMAVILSLGMLAIITRRVTAPLRTIQGDHGQARGR